MTAEEYRVKNKQQQQVGGGGGDIDDPNFDRKFDTIIAGSNAFVKEHLLTRITKENCLTIVNYILAMQTEISPAQSYRIETILNLKLCLFRMSPVSTKMAIDFKNKSLESIFTEIVSRLDSMP